MLGEISLPIEDTSREMKAIIIIILLYIEC